MVDGDANDEYGDDWEQADAGGAGDGHETESGDEKAAESDDEGLVHPLPIGLDRWRDSDDDVLTKKATTTPGDLATEKKGEAKDTAVTVRYSAEVVADHGKRISRAPLSGEVPDVSPPPPQILNAAVGTLASEVAKQRVCEHRRAQTGKEERMKAVQSALYQKRMEVRRMYKPFNRSVGVADVSPEARYRDALKAIRRERLDKEEAITREAASRWYKSVERKRRNTCSAADYWTNVLEEARREYRAKLTAKQEHRRAVEKKLQQLSIEAKTIITRRTGGYEKGSYLLKLSTNSEESQTA